MRTARTGGTAMRSRAKKSTRQSLRISSVVLSPSTPSTQQSRQPHPSLPPPPPLAAAAPTKADTRLEIVNRAFNEKYSAAGAGANGAKRKVHFSEEATWQVIEEPMEPRGRSTSQRRQLGR